MLASQQTDNIETSSLHMKSAPGGARSRPDAHWISDPLDQRDAESIGIRSSPVTGHTPGPPSRGLAGWCSPQATCSAMAVPAASHCTSSSKPSARFVSRARSAILPGKISPRGGPNIRRMADLGEINQQKIRGCRKPRMMQRQIPAVCRRRCWYSASGLARWPLSKCLTRARAAAPRSASFRPPAVAANRKCWSARRRLARRLTLAGPARRQPWLPRTPRAPFSQPREQPRGGRRTGCGGFDILRLEADEPADSSSDGSFGFRRGRESPDHTQDQDSRRCHHGSMIERLGQLDRIPGMERGLRIDQPAVHGAPDRAGRRPRPGTWAATGGQLRGSRQARDDALQRLVQPALGAGQKRFELEVIGRFQRCGQIIGRFPQAGNGIVH